MPMTEAKIVLMRRDNKGKSLKEVNDSLISDVIEKFGGCSSLPGKGFYKGEKGKLYEDEIINLLVAVEPSKSVDEDLLHLAARYKRQAKQEAVMLVNSHREVVFI